MATKTRTKAQLKKIFQRALESEYGFSPALSKIVLLEADMGGTYILASVNGKTYSFDSYVFADGSIWVGPGTIKRKYEEDEY